jgi:hypothetical protein
MSWFVSSHTGFILRWVLELKWKGKNAWDDPEEDGEELARNRFVKIEDFLTTYSY